MLHFIRTLKVDILTLFLTLNIISTLCIISITYIENYTAINAFAAEAAARVGIVTNARIEQLGHDAADVLDSSSSVITEEREISNDNTKLIQYALNVINFNHDISAFMIAGVSGNSIIAENLDLTGQSHYFTDPSKPLPAGSRYLVRIIDPTLKPTPERWIYKDINFNTIASENLPTLSIHVKERPWYINAVTTQKIIWTDFYAFSGTQQPGISMSRPIMDKQGKIIAVVGVDLSSLTFANITFFLHTKGETASGKVYITDDQGKILSLRPEEVAKSEINQKAITQGFNQYLKTHKSTFSLAESKARYMFYVNKTPPAFGKNLYVVIAMAYGSAFSRLVHAQLLIVAIAILILVISIFIIIGFAKRISMPISILAYEINKIKKLNFSSTRRIHSYIKEIKLIDASVAALRTALLSFTRYVPKEVVKQLLARGKDITLEGEKKEVTILFTDVEGFTTIVEKTRVETLMSILAEYFDALSKIILNSRGTIDKYIGDSIMAFWGAPVEVSNHCAVACLTALRCQAFLKEFNRKQKSAGNPPFLTRFGINTGTVIVGNVGTLERMNYTMIGDAVNVASRLESLDKVYHIGIMISETVYKKTGKQFLVRPLDKLAVKGKENEIKIYELVASLQTDPATDATPQQIELCSAFTAAYQAFEAKQYAQAKTLFQVILEKFPDDFPTQMLLQRIDEQNP